MNELIEKIEAKIHNSELTASIILARTFRQNSTFPLTPSEIEQLKIQGNFAEDWASISKTEKEILLNRVWNNYFFGACVIPDLSGKVIFEGKERPCGIYHSHIAGCSFDNNVLVFNVRLLQDQVVHKNAILYNIDELSCVGKTTFGNGTIIIVGDETGGRAFAGISELDAELAFGLLIAKKEVRSQYSALLQTHIDKIACEFGIIGEGACIMNTRSVKNSFIGPFSVVSNVLKIDNCSLLGIYDEPVTLADGVVCADSVFHRGALIANTAIVKSSVMFDHSEVDKHGMISHSWIGANSSVAEGEITSSFVGPFVAAHHQSLLISALWPEGKGNIGYGANVGSNHTGKLPDQEIFPGEGCFFGLGVNIKYPANFMNSPFSIFATGISMLPQKLEMPFSLVKEPGQSVPGLSPAFNEIVPGWILSDNMYMIRRNEIKYFKRNKSKRYAGEADIFSPAIINMMIQARSLLSNAPHKEIYTEKDIRGLGKNYMFEVSRLNAIRVYSFYITYYAWNYLLLKASDYVAGKTENKTLLEYVPDIDGAAHAEIILKQELNGCDAKSALRNFKIMIAQSADAVKQTRQRDEARGIRIMPDYVQSHSTIKEDPVIMSIMKEAEEKTSKIDNLVLKI